MTSQLCRFGKGTALLLAMCVPAWGQDVILEWNAVALQVIVIDHNGPDTPGDQLSNTQGPPASARVLALVHAAMFDAYNTIDPRYTSYLGSPFPSPPGASIDAAVAQAAHDVIVGLYSGNQAPRPEIRQFVDDALQATLARVTSNSSRNKGRTVGKIIAKKLLQLRRMDGNFLGGTYTPVIAVGEHNVDPKHPQQSFISPEIGGLPPFGVSNIVAYRAPPPPSPNSTDPGDILEYAFAFEEVERLGVFRGGTTGAMAPTDDETYVIANFWSYNGSPETGTPPRLYNQIARQIAIRAGNDVWQNARLFALLNISMGDAGISAWDSKYFYRYWRPILGIRQVDYDGNSLTDSNPLTVADPDWCPLGGSRSNPFLLDPGPPPVFESNFSPPFPAYTSGHATFGAAAFKTLANFYQSDAIPDDVENPGDAFIFMSDEWNGSTRDQFYRLRPIVLRTYDSFNCLAAENAASRVFNGVHWRYDGSEGVRAGYGIANENFDNLLRPLGGGGPTSIPNADFEAKIEDILLNTPGEPVPAG